ncbi:glycosyltransferase [Luteolibacter sp. LG18]|uniref:glycosyltransferase n=1 Tax=Luteolibacter sp. LG18 TaxID=2819286 RepID=UPI0030C6B775
MKIIHYTGLLAAQDAIGHAVLAMHGACLARGMESVIYCDDSRIARPDVRVLAGPRAHLREWRRFREADAHVFHFGASYDLFNLVPWVPRRGRRLVYFHGLMPLALAHESARGWLTHAHRKFRLADRADTVLHATDYSREEARKMGVTRPGFARLPLAVDLPVVPRPARAADGIFRLLHVGRLVPNKGLLEVLQALEMLEREGFTAWELEVIHSPHTADAAHEARVRAFLAESGLAGRVRFSGPPESREALARRYAAADLTVLGTRHETYCLPLLESLKCGTPVASFAAGAVAEVAAGHALLAAPGDVAGLAAAIDRARRAWPRMACDGHGTMEAAELHRACGHLLADRDEATFVERWMRILDTVR